MRLAIVLLLISAGLAAAGPKGVQVEGNDEEIVKAVRAGLRAHVRLVDDGSAYVNVTVEVRGAGKTATATAIVHQGDGAEVGRMVVKAKRAKLAAAVKRAAWKQLGAAIDKAEAGKPKPEPPQATAAIAAPTVASGMPPPPPAIDPAPAPAIAAVAPAPAPPPRRRAAPPRLRFAVDERPFWRRLRYNDDLRRVTRSYDLAANAVGVELGLRPAASQPRLELIGAALVAVGVNGSRTRAGEGYPTKASEWSIALGYGGTLGPAHLALRAGYGEHRFHVDDDPAMGAELLPDVTYRFGRAGLDAAIAIAPRWHLLASAGGRYLFGTGDLEGADWFPRVSGHGVDGTLGAAWRAAARLSLYARAEVRHYFFAMNPEVGDPMIVGGATDTYLGGAVGASLALF